MNLPGIVGGAIAVGAKDIGTLGGISGAEKRCKRYLTVAFSVIHEGNPMRGVEYQLNKKERGASPGFRTSRMMRAIRHHGCSWSLNPYTR